MVSPDELLQFKLRLKNMRPKNNPSVIPPKGNRIYESYKIRTLIMYRLVWCYFPDTNEFNIAGTVSVPIQNTGAIIGEDGNQYMLLENVVVDNEEGTLPEGAVMIASGDGQTNGTVVMEGGSGAVEKASISRDDVVTLEGVQDTAEVDMSRVSNMKISLPSKTAGRNAKLSKRKITVAKEGIPIDIAPSSRGFEETTNMSISLSIHGNKKSSKPVFDSLDQDILASREEEGDLIDEPISPQSQIKVIGSLDREKQKVRPVLADELITSNIISAPAWINKAKKMLSPVASPKKGVKSNTSQENTSVRKRGRPRKDAITPKISTKNIKKEKHVESPQKKKRGIKSKEIIEVGENSDHEVEESLEVLVNKVFGKEKRENVVNSPAKIGRGAKVPAKQGRGRLGAKRQMSRKTLLVSPGVFKSTTNQSSSDKSPERKKNKFFKEQSPIQVTPQKRSKAGRPPKANKTTKLSKESKAPNPTDSGEKKKRGRKPKPVVEGSFTEVKRKLRTKPTGNVLIGKAAMEAAMAQLKSMSSLDDHGTRKSMLKLAEQVASTGFTVGSPIHLHGK